MKFPNILKELTSKKYRQRTGILEEGAKTLKVGKGIYTQKRGMLIRLTPILVFMEM